MASSNKSNILYLSSSPPYRSSSFYPLSISHKVHIRCNFILIQLCPQHLPSLPRPSILSPHLLALTTADEPPLSSHLLPISNNPKMNTTSQSSTGAPLPSSDQQTAALDPRWLSLFPPTKQNGSSHSTSSFKDFQLLPPELMLQVLCHVPCAELLNLLQTCDWIREFFLVSRILRVWGF